jgi:hypothetical protein
MKLSPNSLRHTELRRRSLYWMRGRSVKELEGPGDAEGSVVVESGEALEAFESFEVAMMARVVK